MVVVVVEGEEGGGGRSMCRWLSGQQRVPGLLRHTLRQQTETEKDTRKNWARDEPFISCPPDTKTLALSGCQYVFFYLSLYLS